MNYGYFYPHGIPGGSFNSGLVWVGGFNDSASPVLRALGPYVAYSALKPGAILGLRTGIAENPVLPGVRFFRIRRDFATANLRQDAAEVNLENPAMIDEFQIRQIRDQYERDWLEWPASKGAPFYDANSDGIYTPKVVDHVPVPYPLADEPGLGGADQVIWFVCNDLSVQSPWQAPASGMELQATAWACASDSTLQDVVFFRERLIYKGTGTTPPQALASDIYLSQVSTIDVGNFNDDFAGCDSTLNLAYMYNSRQADANYSAFNLAPPAIGVKIVQGPLAKGKAGEDRNRNGVDDAIDNAMFDIRWRTGGFINLPMTAFIYESLEPNQGYPWTPFNIDSVASWSQIMRGLPPVPLGPPDPPAFIDPVSQQPSLFWLSGDPVTEIGWLDGLLHKPSGRYLYPSTGPFSMALGDTQEIVVAFVGGLATNNLSSITAMKFNAQMAQVAYENQFTSPAGPPQPHVQATELDKTIYLSWEDDSASVARTESYAGVGGHHFEGYNVYQLLDSGSNLKSGRRIATFDLVDDVQTIFAQRFDHNLKEFVPVVLQYGTDSGIRRSLLIRSDTLRGRPLVNGQQYYFAVTAYSYTPQQGNPLRALECRPVVLTVVPHTPDPGTRYSYAIGDTVKGGFTDVVGANDAVISPVVFDPTRQRGNSYQIRFDSVTPPAQFRWTLTNAQSGQVILRDVYDRVGPQEHRVPEGGYALTVASPPHGLKSVIDPSTGGDLFAERTTNSRFAVLSGDGTLQGLAGQGRTDHRYEIRFDSKGSWATRVTTSPVTLSVVHVPFSTWDVRRTASDTVRQVIGAFVDADLSRTWNDQPSLFHSNGRTYRAFEGIYISSIPYPPTNDSIGVYSDRTSVYKVVKDRNSPNSAIWNVVIGNLDTTDVTPPPVGTIIRFNKFLEIQSGDIKQFTPLAATVNDVQIARADITRINVFPNPYYGVNRAERDRFHRFVTFCHLPARAVVRIFNLAGHLVRSLIKDDASTQFLQWDLQNLTGLPVASGIYIAYLELKDAQGNDLGTKTLKFCVIMEEQIPNIF